jgi:hypothetical protein
MPQNINSPRKYSHRGQFHQPKGTNAQLQKVVQKRSILSTEFCFTLSSDEFIRIWSKFDFSNFETRIRNSNFAKFRIIDQIRVSNLETEFGQIRSNLNSMFICSLLNSN